MMTCNRLIVDTISVVVGHSGRRAICKLSLYLLLFSGLTNTLLSGAETVVNPEKTVKDWPGEVREIHYPSAADNSSQPALFYTPSGSQPRPLLVALHSWSADYRQSASAPYAEWCLKHGWTFIHPNFRGPNNKPDATGSELAVKDILSAVDYARSTSNIDPERIYLVGVSGGGYGALLLAGRAPKLWTAVSAWVPISDLKAWYFESVKRKQKYAHDIELACGGKPEPGSTAEKECERRSGITYLPQAIGLPLDINAGIHDGHKGSVPVSQTLNAFNAVAAAKDRLSEQDIAFFTQEAQVPPTLKSEAVNDSTYGSRTVLFRRQSGPARVTIFEGSHEIVPEAALAWLAKQHKQSRGD